MEPKKLGRPTDQRLAVLRNQASELLWYGKIETTVDRAKSVRSIAEKLITLAINTYEDTVKVTKTKTNLKGEKVEVEFTNDRSVFFVGFSTGNGVAFLFEFLRERFGVASAKYGCKKCNYKNNGKNFANVLFHKQ